MKTCSRCDLSKSPDEFGSHRGQADGKAIWCRECSRAYDRTRRLRPEVRAAAAAYARRRRQDPKVKARLRLTDALWVERNRELRRQYDTSEATRARNRAYMASDRGREVRRVNEINRRAAKLAAAGTLTVAQWREVLEAFQHRCAYCLTADAVLQIEHVQPLSKGGRHDIDNIVPACKECNMHKSDKSLLQYLAVA